MSRFGQTTLSLQLVVCLAAAGGCDGLHHSPAIGPHHGPYVPRPAGSVPVGGFQPELDEDLLDGVDNPAGEDRLTLVKGRDLYGIHCSPCHGDNARGDGPVSAALSEKVPDLTDSKLQGGASDGAWVHIITTGTMSEVMPGFQADISLPERWVLVRYLRSIRGKPEGKP